MRSYQEYFDDVIEEILESSIDKMKLKHFIRMFDLIVLLSFVSHFFACIWVFIGYQGLIHDNNGWIKTLALNDLIITDYWSIYLASIYWVISTFTSVGYGEICG